MNELALFAGAGGGILGGKLLGWRTVCAVEIDSYARSVLIARQRDGCLEPFPIWDDVTTFDGKPWRGRVDVVSGGFPCQAFSNAARGRNNAADMWPEMLRIVAETEARWVFCENVSEDAIICAQGDLAEIGYKTIRAMFSSQDLGADHARKRWWLVAYANDKSELGSKKYAKMAQLENCGSSVWLSIPKDTRMDDGVAHRMDRFKAIGNGQVPCVARRAWAEMSRWV